MTKDDGKERSRAFSDMTWEEIKELEAFFGQGFIPVKGTYIVINEDGRAHTCEHLRGLNWYFKDEIACIIHIEGRRFAEHAIRREDDDDDPVWQPITDIDPVMVSGFDASTQNLVRVLQSSI